ncbi:MAG: 3-oxoacyl-ACP synthase, partial [Acidimicrobiales bacterium]
MRWEALYVSGVGACLPDRTSAEEAVRQGWYPAEDHADNEIAAVAVSESQAAPVMAVDAARQALSMCGHGPADIAIVLYASAYYQGQ